MARMLPRGRVHTCWVFLWRRSSLLPVAVLGAGFSRTFISPPRVSFQGRGLHWWFSGGRGVFSHCIWFWCPQPGFAAFLGLELKWIPRFYLQGGKVREEEFSLGARSLFSQFCPGQALGPSSLTGDHLYLAVNCRDIVFGPLSQFPYSTHRGILLASHYPVSSWDSDGRLANLILIMLLAISVTTHCMYYTITK